MNFNQINSFLCVCQEGSITQASKKLYISQSALSQQIGRIEEELGLKLFSYDGNKLQLTPRGSQFRIRAQLMAEEYEKTKEILVKPIAGNDQEIINIAVTKYHALFAVLFLIPKFEKLYPNVQINIIEANSYEVEAKLLEKKANLGFCTPPKFLPIKAELIYTAEVLIAVPFENEINRKPHKANGRYPLISPEEVKEQRFINIDHSSPVWPYEEMYFTSNNIRPKFCHGRHSHDIVQKLTAAGYGCSFTPELNAYDQFLYLKQPIYYSTGDSRFMKPVKIGYLEDAVVTPAMRGFIEFASSEMPNLGRELPLNAALQHAGDYFTLKDQDNDN